MAFLVATTSLPAVYRPNGYARTTTAGTPHARAKRVKLTNLKTFTMFVILRWFYIIYLKMSRQCRVPLSQAEQKSIPTILFLRFKRISSQKSLGSRKERFESEIGR